MLKLVAHQSLPVPSHIRQIDGLQVLRAVAVILVAWFHSGILLYSSWPLHLGVFGIDLFFVISGFILSLVVLRERKPPGLGTMWAFLSRRLIRIFPIYWVFCAVFAARMIITHKHVDRNEWFGITLLPSPWDTHPMLLVAFAWTLVFEMFFYYVFAIILLATVRYAVPALILALITLVLCGTLINIRHPIAIVVFNPIHLEFVFGAIIAMAYARWGFHRHTGIALVVLGIVLTLLINAHPSPAVANGFPMVMSNQGVFLRVFTWGIGAALIVGGTVLWSPQLDAKPGRFFITLGAASYSTYLVSPWCLEYITRGMLALFGQPATVTNILLYRLATVIGVALIGWLTYNFIEWPMLRKLQKSFL